MRFVERDGPTGRERTCSRKHASSIRTSCGHRLARTDTGAPELRCDLVEDHVGEHHCCGAGWDAFWGLVVPVIVVEVVADAEELAA